MPFVEEKTGVVEARGGYRWVWLGWGIWLGCSPAPAPTAPPLPPPISPPSSSLPVVHNIPKSLDISEDEPPPDPRPPPLEHPDPFLFLQVQGFGDAVVSLALGARERRPILVAAHGNYDTPESQCWIWREIVGDDGFVLCPRGVVRPDSPSRNDLRYEYVSNQQLEKEIEAGVEALDLAYPDHVDAEAIVFTGFSQGAIMGASIMARRPERYPRAVLIEGGQRVWYPAHAKAFSEGGGQRILWACGQWECHRQAVEAAKVLEKFQIASRVVFSKGEGHTYGGGVADEIRAAFSWVVQGDERWARETRH